jgi:hypothetical protein
MFRRSLKLLAVKFGTRVYKRARPELKRERISATIFDQ